MLPGEPIEITVEPLEVPKPIKEPVKEPVPA